MSASQMPVDKSLLAKSVYWPNVYWQNVCQSNVFRAKDVKYLEDIKAKVKMKIVKNAKK